MNAREDAKQGKQECRVIMEKRGKMEQEGSNRVEDGGGGHGQRESMG
jgi:hypothetical protein